MAKVRLVGPGLGRALQAVVWSDKFILRAMGDWDWDPSGNCVQMGEELGDLGQRIGRNQAGRSPPN